MQNQNGTNKLKERVDQLSRVFEEHCDSFVSDWKQFLSFKSISADPQYHDDCIKCAEWLESHLKGMGFKTGMIASSTKPMVYAEYTHAKEGASTLLFYGHYDVQPADPLELWTSDPFKAELRNGRVYARGAQDNKGQVMYFLKAVEKAIASGKLGCNLKILIEGEEESGSKAISKALPELSSRIKSDVLMVCDTGTVSSEFATITMGLRGILSLEARVDGAAYDLHSGVHGGVVPNPASEIARLVAGLHDQQGRIAIAGYYDSVKPVDPADLALADSMEFDLKAYEAQVGVKASGGEKGLSFFARRGFRPTIEVNGMYSGYTGAGPKTIIPSYAVVKISARLVAGQDPNQCMKLIMDHLKANCDPDLRISFSSLEIGGAALSLSSRSPVISTAREVLDAISIKPTALMWEGASVPIVPGLAEAAGAEPILVGFGMEEDCIHAPNESFGIEQFKKGFLYSSLMLEQFSRPS